MDNVKFGMKASLKNVTALYSDIDIVSFDWKHLNLITHPQLQVLSIPFDTKGALAQELLKQGAVEERMLPTPNQNVVSGQGLNFTNLTVPFLPDGDNCREPVIEASGCDRVDSCLNEPV